jgi:hypothetical protein
MLRSCATTSGHLRRKVPGWPPSVLAICNTPRLSTRKAESRSRFSSTNNGWPIVRPVFAAQAWPICSGGRIQLRGLEPKPRDTGNIAWARIPFNWVEALFSAPGTSICIYTSARHSETTRRPPIFWQRFRQRCPKPVHAGRRRCGLFDLDIEENPSHSAADGLVPAAAKTSAVSCSAIGMNVCTTSESNCVPLLSSKRRTASSWARPGR